MPDQAYGTAEHAALEALTQSPYVFEGYSSGAEASELARVMVEGLRVRGFVVTREPRCECGWTGDGNHVHDQRMGRMEAGRG